MRIVRTIGEVREDIAYAKKEGKRIGFVPTMGYLHEGHISLVRESQKLSDYQVMSIFVNRMQFNDAKDFDKYPVAPDRDSKMAEEAGVDLLFMPNENEMYSERKAYIDIEQLTSHLCGFSRPGHFRGALTVVGKLFNIVQPDVSVFGQKDIQQAISIEKMVEDLNFPLKILIAPIVRDSDGLALSSRNKHLSEGEKKRALSLSSSLRKAGEMLAAGERSWPVIRSAMERMINQADPTMTDYISLVRYEDLQPIDIVSGKCVIALAVFFGTTRLIDNMIVKAAGQVVCKM